MARASSLRTSERSPWSPSLPVMAVIDTTTDDITDLKCVILTIATIKSEPSAEFVRGH
jgi:hypothetical protein